MPLGCREYPREQQGCRECVNDTYLNAWNAIPPHRPQVLSAFLGKITRNLAFNRHKRNTADKRGGGEAAAVLEELAEVVSGKDNVEQEVDRRALVNEIDVFLGKLPAEKRKIFLCRYWYFDSIADIASRFGKSGEWGVGAPAPPAGKITPSSDRKGICYMKQEEFCEIFGGVNEAYVQQAREPGKAKLPAWLPWSAAACFVAAVAARGCVVPNYGNHFGVVPPDSQSGMAEGNFQGDASSTAGILRCIWKQLWLTK